MDTASSTVTDSPQPQNRRALWPWVMIAIVLMLASLVLSFWWPMYRAGVVIRYLDKNDGSYDADYNHPRWTSWFLDVRTFHPWFDDLESISLWDTEVDGTMLSNISHYASLRDLSIKVKSGSEDSLLHLSQLHQLNQLSISVDDTKIPCPTFKGLSDLRYVRLDGVVLDPSLWKVVTQELKLKDLTLIGCCFEGAIKLPSEHNLEILWLFRHGVDPICGKPIACLNFRRSSGVNQKALGGQSEQDSTSNRQITYCDIRSLISKSEWELLSQIEGLESLSIGLAHESSSEQQIKSLFASSELELLSRIKHLNLQTKYGSPSPESRIDNLYSVVILKDLKELELYGDSFRIESNYEFLGQLSRLEKLELDDTPPTTELLRGIALIPRLTELRLDFSTPESADWMILAHCKTLKKLTYTKDCSFRDVVEEFNTARPDVEVTLE